MLNKWDKNTRIPHGMKVWTLEVKTTTGQWFSSRVRGFHWSFDILVLILGWDVSGRRKKNEKENLRILLIPKNCSNLENYYLGSWKQDSNLSSFFAQIWAPVFFMSQERTEHRPATDPLFSCPPDLKKTGLTAVLGTTEATSLWECRILVQHPVLMRGTTLLVPNPQDSRGYSAQAEFLIEIPLVLM